MMWRHEYKYVVSATQVAVLRARAEAVMSADRHAENGVYNIRSVYFDDRHNTFLRENEDGTDPRHKWRIRIYNHSDSHIRLELKARRKMMCRKISCPLTREQTEQLLRGEPTNGGPELLQRLATDMRARGMRPVVVVEYDRVPFIHPVGNVRVTFDCNIRASADCTGFLRPSLPMRPVMPAGQHVAEIKWDELLPDHLRHALQTDGMQWTSFSKFALCRRVTMI